MAEKIPWVPEAEHEDALGSWDQEFQSDFLDHFDSMHPLVSARKRRGPLGGVGMMKGTVQEQERLIRQEEDTLPSAVNVLNSDVRRLREALQGRKYDELSNEEQRNLAGNYRHLSERVNELRSPLFADRDLLEQNKLFAAAEQDILSGSASFEEIQKRADSEDNPWYPTRLEMHQLEKLSVSKEKTSEAAQKNFTDRLGEYSEKLNQEIDRLRNVGQGPDFEDWRYRTVISYTKALKGHKKDLDDAADLVRDSRQLVY